MRSWPIACTAFLILGFTGLGLLWSVRRYQKETYMYPPEILVKKYLIVEPQSPYGSIDTMLDFHRGLLVLRRNGDTVVDEYNLDLNFVRQVRCANFPDYINDIYPLLPNHDADQEAPQYGDRWGTLGSIDYTYLPEKSEWQIGAWMTDMPISKRPSDPNSGVLDTRWLISHRALPSFKDFSIHLDGSVSTQNAASYTGDNLLGTPVKHLAMMPFFTGTWTLFVQGEPVLRQRVRNLCLQSYNLRYSPVYGLVQFGYQARLGGGEATETLYILKVKASGPDIYSYIKNRKDAEITID